MNTELILSAIVLSTFSSIITYAITKRRHYEKGVKFGMDKTKYDLFRNDSIEDALNESIIKWKGTEEYKAILENEFNKGIIFGSKKTMEKFVIRYDSFIETSDEFFKKSADLGYIMQIFYDGLPIGDPTRRVTSHEEKFKEENVNLLIETINNSIEAFIKVSTAQGIPVQISTTPKRIEKPKVKSKPQT